MEIETFYPRDERLKNFIEYYYFVQSDAPDFNSEYYAFPNTCQALNIHKDIEYNIDTHAVDVRGLGNADHFTMLLQGRFDRPLCVRLRGRINKVTIIFKPLGLNYFIRAPFQAIAAGHTQCFNEWSGHDLHHDFLMHFFSGVDNTQRIDLLEKYLLLHYCNLESGVLLREAIAMLSDFNEELPVEEISAKMNMKTRTFNRLFKTQMGISPVGYRKIARFRHSLNNRIFNVQLKKLTEIGYKSNFYDQSYFIKMYRKLTHTAPAAFFKSIDKLADDHLIFKFVKQ